MYASLRVIRIANIPLINYKIYFYLNVRKDQFSLLED